MGEKIFEILFMIVLVAGIAWFLSTRPSGKSQQSGDCHIEWDGRSNSTVCE